MINRILEILLAPFGWLWRRHERSALDILRARMQQPPGVDDGAGELVAAAEAVYRYFQDNWLTEAVILQAQPELVRRLARLHAALEKCRQGSGSEPPNPENKSC